MYLNYFGLAERPFSIAPDPQYLYMSARHREASAHLSYGLSQGGCFIVLTGEVGTGKTTLCRSLLADLPDNVDVALILNPNINRRELLETVCDELKIDYREQQSKKRMLDKINEYLLERYADGRHTVLIIDEAQLLSRTVLEQIRLLTNLETTKAKLLQIILIGQPELNDLLSRQDLRQLAQRVTARYHLPAISREEIQDYVNFRLGVAGCKKPLFSAQALKILHQASDGIPRKINVIADHALLAAYAESEPLVDSKIVKQAAKDVLVEQKRPATVSWLPVATGLIAAALIVNVSLWWWFAGQSGGSQSPPMASATQAVESAEQQATAVDRNLNQDQDQEPLTTIIKPDDVEPGSVVIADEFLDDSQADVPELQEDPDPQLTLLSNLQPVSQPEPPYLANSAFGRVLEVSPDRTGRVAAFRNLAAAWDVDLSGAMLSPVCDELQQRGVKCQTVKSWPSLQRMNRPTIMVLSHKGTEHRVILYKVQANTASVLVGDQTYDVPVAELRDRWAGNAIVLWRPSELGDDLLQLGDQNEKIPLLRSKLNEILSKQSLPVLKDASSDLYDFDMTEKITELQMRFGLMADGKIGRETYLLLNELLQATEVPVLQPRGA